MESRKAQRKSLTLSQKKQFLHQSQYKPISTNADRALWRPEKEPSASEPYAIGEHQKEMRKTFRDATAIKSLINRQLPMPKLLFETSHASQEQVDCFEKPRER